MKLLGAVFSVGLGVWLLLGATVHDPVDAKLSADLIGELSRDQGPYQVFLQFNEKASLVGLDEAVDRSEKAIALYQRLTETARQSQSAVMEALEKEGLEYRSYYINNSLLIKGISEDQIRRLASRDDIKRVVSDRTFVALPPVELTPILDAAEKGPGSNIVATGAHKVWEQLNIRGEGIVVAGQDTGIDWDHPALKRQYRGWNGKTASHDYHWYDAVEESFGGGNNSCGYATVAPCDDHGHGTHTVGTIVGDDRRGNQVGMAPEAKWIGCRNMDAGLGRPSSYIGCFQFFFAPFPYGGDPATQGDPTKAPHVINNSWGCPPSEGCRDAEILPILEVLKEAGIFVVASAGNDGSSCRTITNAPAMHSAQTLSVGAHNSGSSTGAIASFSSRGPSAFDGEIGPDVTAPGVRVRSAVPGGGFSGSYWSGTSMAGPHVVGQIALLWSADATLIGDYDGTTEVIRSTATPTQSSQQCGGVSGSSIPNNTFGYGRIDAYKAVASRL